MAIQYVGSNIGTKAGSTSGTTTLSLTALTGGISSSAAIGDLVIAVFATGSTANRTLSITTGYTTVNTERYSIGATYDTNLLVAYKFLTAADTTVTFGPTGNNADAGAYAVHVFRGVDSTAQPPDGDFYFGWNGLDGANTGRPSFSTSFFNPAYPAESTLYVVGAGAAATGAVFTQSYLSGFRTATSADTNDVSLGAGYIDLTSSADYTPATWGGGSTNTANSYASMVFRLRATSTAIPADQDESASATDAQSATYDLGPAEITETALALDQQSATKSYDVDITESVSATDTSDAAFIIWEDVAESVTATDSSDGQIEYGVSINESVSATDSETAVDIANSFIFEDTSGTVIPGVFSFDGNNDPVSTTYDVYGLKFLSSYSGQVGLVKIAVVRSLVGTIPSQLGYVKIFNISSVNDSTLGTLVAELPVKFTDLTLGSSVPVTEFDFSNIPGATLTSGNSYFIVLVPGSDWIYNFPTVALATRSSFSATNTPSIYATFANKIAYPASASISNVVPGGNIGFAVQYVTHTVQKAGTTTADTQTSTADFQVAQSETVTATDSETASLSTSADQAESVTATDSEDSILQYGVSITESVSAIETETNVLTANAWIAQSDAGNALVNANSGFTLFSQQTLASANRAFGNRFIANSTTNLGIARLQITRTNTGRPLPTQPGTVELWQLASNSLTADPQTLLASISFNLGDIPPVGDLTIPFDFTGVSGASVTAGVGYAVVVRSGSDWSGSTQTLNIGAVDFNTPTPFNYLYSLYRYAFFNGSSWFSNTQILFLLDLYPATTTIDAQTTNVDWQVAQDESALATDSENAVFAFPVDITETVTATDTEEASFSVGVNQDETVTATDSEDATYAYGVAVTETVNAADSETAVNTANAWDYEPSSGNEVFSSSTTGLTFASAYALFAPGTGSGVQAAGASFIAGSTTPIGKVTFLARKNGVVGTQPGAVELWQLASNSLTATPQTLLAAVPFSIDGIPTTPGGANFSVDFTGVSGAAVTAGVGYAIVCRAGSDWTNTSASVTIYGTGFSNTTQFNAFYPTSRVASVNSSGSWVSPVTNVAGNIAVEPANTTTDAEEAGFVASSDITETVTATDDETATLDQAADITETVTATVSEDSILEYGVSVSESVTATDSETNTLTALGAINEGGVLVNTLFTGTANASSASTPFGIAFTAAKTVEIETILFQVYRAPSSVADPTLALYQGNTLVASVTVPYTRIGTSSGSQTAVTVAGLGFSLVSGLPYTIRLIPVSGHPLIPNYYNQPPTNNSFSPQNVNLSSAAGIFNYPTDNIRINIFRVMERVATETQLPGLAYQVAQDEAALALDSEDAVFAISVDQNETVTATDTEDTTYSTTANQDESVTATDEETASIPVSAAQDEAVTATETQTNTLDTSAEQDEAVTATDSETANFVTNSDITESVTATESNVVYVDFTAQITETLNLVSSESAVSVLPVSITEAVAANDEWVAESSAIFSVTGVQANTFLGTASINTDQILSVTGVQGTTQLGTAAVVGSAVVDLTGVQGTTQLGTATVTGTTNVYPTSVTALGAVGNVSLVTDNFINVTGVQGATNLGTASISIGEFVNVTGVQGTTQLGSVSVTIAQFVNVSGVQADIILNKVNVWGNIVPNPTGPWSNVNDSQSNNWVIIDKAA